MTIILGIWIICKGKVVILNISWVLLNMQIILILSASSSKKNYKYATLLVTIQRGNVIKKI